VAGVCAEFAVFTLLIVERDGSSWSHCLLQLLSFYWWL